MASWCRGEMMMSLLIVAGKDYFGQGNRVKKGVTKG